MKIEFENEDEAIEFVKDNFRFFVGIDGAYTDIKNTVKTFKEKGYIKRSDLEKAKEQYNKPNNQYKESNCPIRTNVNTVYKVAADNLIYELEKEIERLKNG